MDEIQNIRVFLIIFRIKNLQFSHQNKKVYFRHCHNYKVKKRIFNICKNHVDRVYN